MDTKECLKRKLGLKNIKSSAKLFYSKKDPDLFRASGIVIFSGAQGSGKTLDMINTLLDLVKRYPKAKVFSNIKLNDISYLPFTGVENFSDEESNGTLGTIYVIDEIHTLWSSLSSKNMVGDELIIWSQNRKNRRLILSTSQRFSRVAKPIREQCTYVVECKRPFARIFFKYRIIDASYYDDQGNLAFDSEEEKEVISRWSWYIPSLASLKAYDTMEIVKREKKKK